jgi:hypothetical protein
MRLIPCLVLIAAAALPLLAAETTLEIETGVIFLYLPGANSRCTPEAADESQESRATCTSNQFMVVASAANGCEFLNGPGYCGSLPPGDTPIVGAELTCANGVGYYLLAGSEPIRCTRSEGSMLCESTDDKSLAGADCDNGCLRTTGAGVCCMTGTNGCPPGLATESED